MTTPKTFAGFSEEDARREAARQAGLPPPTTGKKGRKKKTPEVPVVPAVPAPAPAPAVRPTANPAVFGIERRHRTTAKNYTMSGVTFLNNYFQVDFDTLPCAVGAQNIDFWKTASKANIPEEPSKRVHYVGWAPLYYSIWKTLYEGRNHSSFSVLVETARKELSDVLNTKSIMTLSQVIWAQGGDKDRVINEDYLGSYVRYEANMKGAPGSLKGNLIYAASFCKAVFDTDNVKEVCSVLEWLTGKEPFLLRKDNSNVTPAACPIIIEANKFCYIKTAENPLIKAHALPVYVHNLRQPTP
jgi:hypothetical protein